MIPKTLKILRTTGILKSKTSGKVFYMAFAESPNSIPGGFSTIRWTLVSPNDDFVVGQEVPCKPASIDFEKATGVCRV